LLLVVALLLVVVAAAVLASSQWLLLLRPLELTLRRCSPCAATRGERAGFLRSLA